MRLSMSERERKRECEFKRERGEGAPEVINGNEKVVKTDLQPRAIRPSKFK